MSAISDRAAGVARRHACAFAALALVVNLTANSPGRATAQVVDPWFPDTDRSVSATLLVGDTLYVGGGFTRIGGTRTGGFVSLDKRTALPGPGWPRVDGTVFACAPDGRGGWYLGGDFTGVSGVPRRGLAHVRADRSLDGWAPEVAGGSAPTVRALVVSGGALYVGGKFTSIGGQPRNNLAAVSLSTGLATDWNPGAAGLDNVVDALLLRSGVLYVGGSFSTLGGATRAWFGSLDLATATTTQWNPAVNGRVYALAVSGSTLFAGGAFTSVGGQTRSALASFDLASGNLSSWDPLLQHSVVTPAVTALAALGSTVYVGGSFTVAGGEPRSCLAAFDALGGFVKPWNPDAQGGQYPTVFALSVLDTLLYAGGAFTGLAGSSRAHLAAIGTASGAVTSWDPGAYANVYCLAATNGGIFAGGAFSAVGGVARAGLAAIDVRTNRAADWNPGVTGSVSALAGNRERIYAAGSLTAVGGHARRGFAAVHPRTGIVLDWNPEALGGESPSVFAMAANDSTVFVGGYFSTLGGAPRAGLAAIDAASGVTRAWNANLGGPSPIVRSLGLADSTLFFCGSFGSVGSQYRSSVAAVEVATGLATTWMPVPQGSFLSLEAVVVEDDTVYVGGRYSSMNGYGRSSISAFDAATGALTEWNPGVFHTPYANVYELAAHGSNVYIGGMFESVGGQPRTGLAAVDAATGAVTDWVPDTQAAPTSIACRDEVVFVGGPIVTADGRRTNGLAAISTTLPTAPTVQLQSPMDGRTFVVSSTIRVEWVANAGLPGGIQSVDLSLSRTGPEGPWEVVAAGAPNSGHYDWKLPGPEVVASAYLRISARDYAGRTALDQTSVPFSIVNWAADVPDDGEVALSLGVPSPNPMGRAGWVSMTLPSVAAVRLTIADVQGRVVATVANGSFAAGLHRLPISTAALRPGVYFVRLEAAGRAVSRRFATLP